MGIYRYELKATGSGETMCKGEVHAHGFASAATAAFELAGYTHDLENYRMSITYFVDLRGQTVVFKAVQKMTYEVDYSDEAMAWA